MRVDEYGFRCPRRLPLRVDVRRATGTQALHTESTWLKQTLDVVGIAVHVGHVRRNIGDRQQLDEVGEDGRFMGDPVLLDRGGDLRDVAVRRPRGESSLMASGCKVPGSAPITSSR